MPPQSPTAMRPAGSAAMLLHRQCGSELDICSSCLVSQSITCPQQKVFGQVHECLQGRAQLHVGPEAD